MFTREKIIVKYDTTVFNFIHEKLTIKKIQ